METLAISAEYIDATEFAAIASKLDCTTRLNCYDEFDMYQGSDVYKSGNNILSDRVTYKSLLKTENGRTFEQLSHTVASESISAGGTALTTRAYTTDNLGRVTGIADSLFGNHSYEYDCRGFLVKDGNIVYEYDANGNVTKIGTTVLEYDNTVKDKLVKVGDKPVTYGSNPLVPTSYDGNTYTFEGRRLTKIQKGGKTIDYAYNDQGLRIKKTVTETGTSVATRYFYDDNKLVAEISPTHRLDFLYDENDRLYGFVLDKTAMYFYVRDALENILGIVDSTGNLVVQYAYNAWGKIQSITGTLATTVGEFNPFRYKGYYFDKETGMYYCHSRYYMSEWCRWLCADSHMYLQEDSLFGLNPYMYCENNPIVNSDENGYISKGLKRFFTILACIAVITIAVAATVATGGIVSPILIGAGVGGLVNAGISAGVQYATTGNVDWGQFAVDFFVGAAFGSIGGTALGSGGMAVSNGLMSFGSSVANDWISGNDINWAKAAVAGAVGGLIGYASGGGAQHGLTGARKSALATKRKIEQRYRNGGYRADINYAFARGSNQGRIDSVTAALKKSAIYNIITGSISSLEISVYQALLFA